MRKEEREVIAKYTALMEHCPYLRVSVGYGDNAGIGGKISPNAFSAVTAGIATDATGKIQKS